ncbi:phage integrase family protein [Burkholderia ubonensis]|uniref:phage integrase family protein n=1 Tax=Burkholderia ubonensis TaxID=101571 RepID=UPI001E311007|nr:phage integrase family protein [Burkholderia ubonensis]
MDLLSSLPLPEPQVSDPVDVWLSSRAVAALHQHGIRTLAELTVRIPRRRRLWLTIPGLGVRSARQIENIDRLRNSWARPSSAAPRTRSVSSTMRRTGREAYFHWSIHGIAASNSRPAMPQSQARSAVPGFLRECP